MKNKKTASLYYLQETFKVITKLDQKIQQNQ